MSGAEIKIKFLFRPSTVGPIVTNIESSWLDARAKLAAAAGDQFARSVDGIVAATRLQIIERRSTCADPADVLWKYTSMLLTAIDVLCAQELAGREERQAAAQSITRLVSLFLNLRAAIAEEAR